MKDSMTHDELLAYSDRIGRLCDWLMRASCFALALTVVAAWLERGGWVFCLWSVSFLLNTLSRRHHERLMTAFRVRSDFYLEESSAMLQRPAVVALVRGRPSGDRRAN